MACPGQIACCDAKWWCIEHKVHSNSGNSSRNTLSVVGGSIYWRRRRVHEEMRAHYDRLAPMYDQNRAYSAGFLHWITGCILAGCE